MLLGADPSNFSNKGVTNKLTTVFDLDKSGYIYFKGSVIIGLKTLGIKMEEIYVQNLIRNYFNLVTGKNKHWKAIATYWVKN